MCHYCERPCWRDGSDGARECDYTDKEWARMEAEEWDDLNRRYGITKERVNTLAMRDASGAGQTAGPASAPVVTSSSPGATE